MTEMEKSLWTKRFLKAGRFSIYKLDGKYGGIIESPNDASGIHTDYSIGLFDTFKEAAVRVCNMIDKRWPDTEFYVTHLLDEEIMNFITSEKLRSATTKM